MSFVETTSRKISGQKYLEFEEWEGGWAHCLDFRAERRMRRRVARSRRKIASLPGNSLALSG